MTNRPPPVPPANRSPKGPGSAEPAQTDTAGKKPQPENLNEQGRFGNIKQNTTHSGAIKGPR